MGGGRWRGDGKGDGGSSVGGDGYGGCTKFIVGGGVGVESAIFGGDQSKI